MEHTLFTTEQRALLRLHWQPGSVMHTDWWHYLSLENWKTAYQQPTMQPAIDTLIIQRRGFSCCPTLDQLSTQQSMFLSMSPHLDKLLTALGLIALRCPVYLLLQPFRDQLAPVLDTAACQQILSLSTEWQKDAPQCTAEQLADYALRIGLRWWLQQNQCPVTQLLATRYSPDQHLDTDAAMTTGDALHWLMKLWRYL
ncbi:hypothetical protein CIG19_14770 [Enterobacterales bacterium CwR94]|nr:hypothetical protein CIG19_14770 [Enterobacterales bacterium CwR94]